MPVFVPQPDITAVSRSPLPFYFQVTDRLKMIKAKGFQGIPLKGFRGAKHKARAKNNFRNMKSTYLENFFSLIPCFMFFELL
jgi:hypothetical protein